MSGLLSDGSLQLAPLGGCSGIPEGLLPTSKSHHSSHWDISRAQVRDPGLMPDTFFLPIQLFST